MAYYLFNTPPSFSHERQPLCKSLPSSPFPNFNQKQSLYLLKYNPFTFHSRTPLHLNHVSLKPPVSTETQNPNPIKEVNPRGRNGSSRSSSRKHVWVNPNSLRASQLYDSRYVSLVKLAHSLDSLVSWNESDVVDALNGYGKRFLEQDGVIILNNMTNPETALLALKYFQNNLKPSREVVFYNVTLKVFRKCKDLDRAEKLFDEMLERNVKPDNVTFSTMIICSRICNFPSKAVEWFEKMQSFGCKPDDVTYSAMIDAYARAGNNDMALSLYEHAKKEKLVIDPVSFATMIRIHGASGNFDECLNVYEEMKALGVKTNLVIYNTLLDAMGKAKRGWQAKTIYKDLISNGFTPNWVTYGALLRVYGRARYGDDALIVYKEMKAKGLELSSILYNTLLAMCADIGFTDEAVSIYEDFKSSLTCKPDSWTFSSMITIFSCTGKVVEAEAALKDMMEAGFEPNIFVYTSMIQCYGKAQRTDDVVKTFNRVLDLNISPDDRFCGCLLNVMTQTPKEELAKLIDCIEKANSKLGYVVKLLVQEKDSNGEFKKIASELLESIGVDVKKAYCNCLIDMCVNLNLLEKACELLDVGIKFEIYTNLQSRSPTQWSLHLKSLSLGAALTALHDWINDLSRALESKEELPPLLGINTGHGKHKFSDKGLAFVFETHLKELNAPFHEAQDKVGWFLTTKNAAKLWLESKGSADLVPAHARRS